MSFNVVPTLSFTSALSVSASLYFNKGLLRSGALAVNSLTASENVDLLPLPGNIKKEILCLIQPVGEQIQAWLSSLSLAVRISLARICLAGYINLHGQLSWIPLGAIDYGRTAANCATSDKWLDIEAFELACSGSDPENIHRLWPLVKANVLEEVSMNGLVVVNKSKRFLLWYKFWVAYLTDQMEEFKRVNHFDDFADDEYFLVRLAVKYNNVGATRFFLEKMTNTCGLNQLILCLAKECVLLHRRDFDPSIFVFLASYLSEEQVKTLLNYRKTECLIHFLKWPLLRFVIPMSELVWSDFPFEMGLEGLLQMVLLKIMQTPVPVVYENIFKALWIKTPQCHQRAFFDGQTTYILCNLFNGYTLEVVIKALFKDNPAAYKKFVQEFLSNASAVISISVEENKFKAFKNVLQQLFPKENLVEDFENVYAKYTQVYVDAYYGNNISSDTDTE